MAQQITVNVPVAGAAGNKEFSAGSDDSERELPYDELLDHPERYLGQTVIISAEVEARFLTPHTFTLGDRGLLAISAKPRPELFVEAALYVAREVRSFGLEEVEQEPGSDLDEAKLRQYEGGAVLIVEVVEVKT